MTIEEIKAAIEQSTGVPASLLTGETEEENIAQAKAFLAYRKEAAENRPKSTRDQFAAWLDASQGIEHPDTAGASMEEMQEALRIAAGGYPRVPDGGEPTGNPPDTRPAREQFAEFFGRISAYNPNESHGNW